MTADAVQSPDLADTLFAAIVALTPGRTVRLALEMWSYGADEGTIAGTLRRNWIVTILTPGQRGYGHVLRAEYHDAAGLVSQVREHMAARVTAEAEAEAELASAVDAHRAATAAYYAMAGSTDGSEEMARDALAKAKARLGEALAAAGLA
jgi:hypothetical protein